MAEKLAAETKTKTQPSNDDIIHREPIEGTPFALIGTTEKGYAIIMANRIITEFKPTKHEALRLLTAEKWNIIINVICGVIALDRDGKVPVK